MLPQFAGKSADAPPLRRGGWEGLGFLPYDPKLTTLARANRKNPTPAEKKIWFEVLRHNQFAAYKFLRQKPIDRFIVDFYCHEARLVIEVDGGIHENEENKEYDEGRTYELKKFGLTVLRFKNDDIENKLWGVLKILENEINIRINR